MLLKQVRPVPHAVPHAPQFPSLPRRSKQPPAQKVRPGAQTQVPATQAEKLGHARPQAPQAVRSVWVS